MGLDDYYKSAPFPKPQDRKKKKKVNGYKDKAERICYYCGKDNAERHEVFGGPYRQTSIDMNFQIDVCPEHHRLLQENIVTWAQTENRKLKMYFQMLYEEKLIDSGITPQHARKLWLALIGKNYLHEV